MTFGERITQLRKKHSLSQDQLAEKLEMNRVNVSNYETGKIKSIPSDTLIKCSDIFKVSADYLLGKTDDETNPSVGFATKIEVSTKNKDFSITVDGDPLTKDEKDSVTAYIRTLRSMRSS